MGKKSKQNSNNNQQQPQLAAAAASPAKKAESAKKAAPVEIVSVPGFFGHAIAPGQTLVWPNEVEEFVLQLNSAALGASVSSGRSTLYVLAKEAKTALCTLIPEKSEQFALAHTFTPMDGEIAFVVEGVNTIHLSGFIDVQDEGDDEDDDRHDYDDSSDDDHEGHDHAHDHDHDDDDDDSMDEEEEMMVFGDQSDSDDDDLEEDDGESEEDSEGRFEVIEERLHGDAAEKKGKSPAKKAEEPAAPKTPAKKAEEPAAKKTPAKKAEQPAAKKAEQPEKKAAAEPSKKEAAAAAKTEKKIAEKVAELTATGAGKKRAAPAESVDVPKKAKSSAREYKGVKIEEHAVGKGQPAMKGRKVSILYKGRLENGKQFDANQNRKKPFSFRHGIGDVIKGMDIGIEGMRAGGKRTITIPSKLGYGKSGAPPTIPGNATLIFDIEML